MNDQTATGPTVELPTSDCSICTHEKAAEIDEALLGGTPIRTVAGTYSLSRSSVGRHRQNHLSAEAIAEPDPEQEREPLRIVDVHGQLTALCDRLEKVVELATRTRKAPAAVAAMRELRQTLEAVARIQADPALQRAASRNQMEEDLLSSRVHFTMECLRFVMSTAGLNDSSNGRSTWYALMAQCLRQGRTTDLDKPSFAGVDTSDARRYLDARALAQTQRMEAEVQRRVEAELRRRENQQRPALESHAPLAIEGGVA